MSSDETPPRMGWSTLLQIGTWLVLGGFGGAMVIGVNERQDTDIAEIKAQLKSIDATQAAICEVLQCRKQGIRP